MASVSKQSFGINLIVMRAFGLYSPQEATRLYKVMSYLMYIFLMLPVPVFGTLYLLVNDNFDMMRLNDNAFLIAEITCQFTKLFPFINNADRIRNCIHYFEASIFAVFKERQLKILEECINICVRNSRIYLCSVVSINIIWAAKPFLEEEYRLPVDLWLPYNSNSGALVYYPTFTLLVIGNSLKCDLRRVVILQSSAVAYVSIACAAIDPLIAGLAFQASSQFQILKDNLENLNESDDIKNTDDNINVAEKSDTIKNRIRYCIRHHNEILR
jgi:hypothetical protein